MFTKQHYRIVAEIIKNGHGDEKDNWNSGRWDASKIIAEQLANYFIIDNSNFDRKKFLKACGLE